MPKIKESGPPTFLFREIPQNILIGTASDRYAGWIGKIYSEGRYEKGITRRSHKAGGNAPLMAQKIAERLHSGKQQKVL